MCSNDGSSLEIMIIRLRGDHHSFQSLRTASFKVAAGLRSGNERIKLWDVERRKVTRAHCHYTISILNNEHVVSASYDGTVREWHVESGKTVPGPIKACVHGSAHLIPNTTC